MMLDTSVLTLITDKPVQEQAGKLRGAIGGMFPDYPLLHHHLEDGYLRLYPKVQYKVIEGTPIILGIEEGSKLLKKISGEIKSLELENSKYKVMSRQINEQEVEIIATREERKYRFISPWLALNQNNYNKFLEIKDIREKKLFINNILIGNILSMCKGLGIIVDRNLYVHSRLNTNKDEFKNIFLKSFSGEFIVNFKIPDLFGLGKSVSHGYGIVKNLEKNEILSE